MSFKSTPKNRSIPQPDASKSAGAQKEELTNLIHFGWVIKDGVVLSCIGLAFFLFIVLFSYESQDPGFDSVGSVHDILNYGGKTGAWLSSMILYVFGLFGFLIPFGILFAGWVTLKIRTGNELDYLRFMMSLLGLLFLITAGAGLANLYVNPQSGFINLPYSAGGVLGYEFSDWLVSSIDLLGATLVLLVIFAIAFSMLSSCSWLTIVDVTGQKAWAFFDYIQNIFKDKVVQSERVQSKVKAFTERRAEDSTKATNTIKPTDEPKTPVLSALKILAEKQVAKVNAAKSEKTVEPSPTVMAKLANATAPLNKKKSANLSSTTVTEGETSGGVEPSVEPVALKVGEKQSIPTSESILTTGALPSLDLLAPAPVYEEGFTQKELIALSELLEQRLLEFGVTVQVESVQPGPVVTRFEILPAAGVKVSQINNLAKDLARVLSVQSVRVVDVIPGKAVVGIEIPNEQREIVSFRDVLASDEFQSASSPLTIALGKDIAGKPVVADIGKMPHLLVAGTTGSGKSVGVNSMILSLLYKSTPEEVRLIMVDPKMLELSVYDDIPHLLTPVVTDMSDAANALRWCVFEMDRRYQLMAKLGVRNIAGYNLKVQKAIDEGNPIIDPLYQQVANYGHELGEAPPTLGKLPYIVVVVDEFADMIMVVGKEVEQLIARVAQKARAAGIHLVLATQRPSVNVITGLIKANIPTRISFMVSTKIDSRTILDQGGAEQLLGMGDMLFLPPGSGNPKRVHGAYMTDEEVHSVADFVRSQGAPNYLEAITQAPTQSEASGKGADAESDDLYDAAVEFVIQSRRVSISAVQRNFRIGYNRAARIVETMESSGVISTSGANGNREVLAPKPQE